MSDIIKTIGEWEKIKGFILEGADPKQKISEAELDALPLGKKLGCDHVVREKFLRDNNYEVTRSNMIAPELSTKDPTVIRVS